MASNVEDSQVKSKVAELEARKDQEIVVLNVGGKR